MDSPVPALRHFETVRRMVGLDAIDEYGWTRLHFAAAEGSGFCRHLIETWELDVNSKSKKGETPLHLAVLGRYLNTASYLIESGANVNDTDIDGMGALHLAAKNGITQLLQLLISKGADIEAPSLLGTPLQIAIFNKRPEAVKILLDSKCNPNSCPTVHLSPLMLAIVDSSFECLDILLKGGADPDFTVSVMKPLHLAALGYGTEFVNVLLSAGANPNMLDVVWYTPFEVAVMEKNFDVVKILFPVTSRIFSFSDRDNQRRKCRMKEYAVLKKQEGDVALARADYMNAFCRYTESIYLFPDDAHVSSNRSLCFTSMGFGDRALNDAQSSIELEPDWAMAHYREGQAWMLLKNYEKAADAFFRASTLDSESLEFMHAYLEAAKADLRQ